MHTLQHNGIQRLPEHWRWLGTRVRLGLTPDEPRMIAAYLETGRQACVAGLLNPWWMGEQSFKLLLAAALDPHLPWHWRMHCLNQAHQPLMQLEQIVERHPQWRPVFVSLAQRLARAEMCPSHLPMMDPPYAERPAIPGKT